MKVKVFTIFPDMFPGFLGYSLTGRALSDGLWSLEAVDIRDYAFDKHGSVDDTPTGEPEWLCGPMFWLMP